ncbi:MAG: cytochrome P450 [Acidobacteria bacterium]|nr:cytochrome P450 [Acidobacteriota bacterium]
MPYDNANKNVTSLPPSQLPSFIGGHLPAFWRDRTAFLTRQAELGDVTFLRMGPQPVFFLNHPDLIRDLFVVNADKFEKGRALKRAKVLLGEGLLTSEREAHLRQRRMIQPAFHRIRIAEYSRSMVEYAEQMAASWQDGETRDIDKEMMHLTLQIVAKTLFNAEVEDDADEIGAAMTTMVELFNFLLLPFSEWLEKLPIPHSIRFKRAKKKLDEVIYGIINERRRTGEDKGDLLSMLLMAQDEDDGGTMTDQQVRDEALTLFLAGHETTANALTWTWYLLSQNPEAEAKLHAELVSAFAEGGNLSGSEGVLSASDTSIDAKNTLATGRVSAFRTPTINDIPNLKFTEAVLAESMRLYPPAWAIGRNVIAAHDFGGFTAKPGTLILTSPFITHRDARFFDDPLEFRPERWETMSVKEAGNRNIYFPFGGGGRRCIGESFAWTEGILLIATIARKWKLSLDQGQKIGLNPQITLRPKFGMRMTCQSRER